MSKRREYMSTIVVSCNGNEKEFIKKNFSKKKKFTEHLKKVDFPEIMDYLQKELEILKVEIEMQRKLLAISTVQVHEAEANVQKAQQQLAEKKKCLKEIEQEKEEVEKKKIETQYKFEKFKRWEKELKNIVLAHKTATTKQIVAHTNGHIISTKRDVTWLQERGVVIDEEFNPRDAEHLITQIPADISEKYENLEWKSLIDFCEMVANYKLATEKGEETNIILLYSNIDIAEILKLNGLDVY